MCSLFVLPQLALSLALSPVSISITTLPQSELALVPPFASVTAHGVDSTEQVALDALRKGNVTEAARLFRMIASGRLDELVALSAANTLVSVGDYDASIRFLWRVHVLQPGNVACLHQLARAYEEVGNHAESEAAYKQILMLDSTFTPAIIALGRTCLDKRDYMSAAGLFAGAIRQNPKDFLANYYYGFSLTKLGMPDSAFLFLGASLSLNRRHVPTIALLASMYYRRKAYADASRMFEQAMTLVPWNAEYWYMAGQCQELLGERQSAIRSITKAIILDSTNSAYPARLGQVYFALGRYDSALSAFTAAAALEEENPSILFNIGLTLARMDSVIRAAKAFEQAAKAQHVEKVGSVYRQWGALYYTHDQYRKAERQYRRAVQADPSNPEGWFFYAICLDRKGDVKNGSAAYRRFLTVAAGDPGVSRKWLESARRRLKVISR